MVLNTLNITPYHRRYLQSVRDLIFHSNQVHTHLDWYETDAWMETGDVQIRLAWSRGRLVGILAASHPLNNTTWIRLAAVHDRVDTQAVLYALWQDLVPEMRASGVRLAAVLAVRDWLIPFLPTLGFGYGEDIITLARFGHELPDPLPNPPFIRVAEARDLEHMTAVDQTAFPPPWQLSLDELRQAYRISSSCTVAVKDDTIVGYQLSTLYFDGAHLARLAVAPHIQGSGIGGALLGEALTRFFRRGIYSMTLNTQASNHRSRRLYTRFGFQPNGYDLPYWSAQIQ